MTPILKLDFNERSDQISRLAKDCRYDQALWQYPCRQGLEQQLAALNQLNDEQVLCTNGGDEAIYILMRIIKETAKLILPLPAFSQYTWGVQSWDLVADLIAAKTDLSIDVGATLTAIEQSENSITILTRPNNPTGEAIAEQDLIELIETAQQNQGWVFLDEAYIEFSDAYQHPLTNNAASNNAITNTAQKLLQRYDNLVMLRTFSKAFGLAGIRLGYLLGSQKLIEQFKQRCMPFNIPQPSLAIAQQALATENLEEVSQYCRQIQINRQQLFEWLTQAGVKVLPSQANFLLLQLPEKQAQAVKSFLAKNSVLVRSFEQVELSGCLRITIPFDTERLLKLLQQALRPQLICLDMDGVLIDTSASYDATIMATVEKMCGRQVSSEDIFELRDSGGFNNDWSLTQQLLTNLKYDFSLQQVTDSFQQIYLGDNNDGLVSNEVALISSQLVSKIVQIQQTQFAIVTGRPRNEAKAGKTFLGLQTLELISLDDVEQAKPSPEGINRLQQKYSTLSWMCGDNPDDMQAAVASNSLAIGISQRNQSALYAAGADIVLDNINQLEAWLCPIK